MSAVHYILEGEVATITIDSPPVNALSHPTRVALDAALNRAEQDPAALAVILLGAGRTFVAGADISEFGTEYAKMEPLQSSIQRRIEGFPKLVVAAIHGVALGGGLELALACHARVAVVDAKLGLPEVTLGLIPGAGGTQRLPRLVGPGLALDLTTSGRTISGAQGFDHGLVDALVEEVREGAIRFATDAIAQGRSFTPPLQRDEKLRDCDPALFDEWRRRLEKTMPGRLAPQAIVDCISAACTMNAAEGAQYEKMRSLEMKATTQHIALKRYFFIEREARKLPASLGDVPAKEIRSVAVIGSGTMGGGIAMAFANNGFAVTLLDMEEAALEKGRSRIAQNYEMSVSRSAMTREQADKALTRIAPTIRYDDICEADLIVEAVPEDMDIKKGVFATLNRIAAPHAILATNTSTLSIDQMAAATSRPEKVVGLHFFAPANIMKLLEVVRGEKTDGESIATAMALGKRIGKVVVLARNCDGFIGNRMLQYYSGQAEFLLEQGATPEQVDRVALAFGMPMGPFALRDMTGIDVNVLVRRARRRTLGPGDRMSMIPDRLFEAGRLGQKSGAGYYRYEGPERFADPAAIEIIEQVAREAGMSRRSFTDEEISDRLFMPLVNEGAKELEDGTAMRPGDIDVAWINGYGFPKHKGGPMFWGETVGLARVRDLALELAETNGPRWGPGTLLTELARSGRGWDSPSRLVPRALAGR